MAHMDLHMHSSVSIDGDISPRGLAELCCQEGITLAALTDHNAVSGVPEFIWRGAQLGVRAIPAVELDCMASDLHLHILGYGIDISSAELVHIECSVRQMEKETFYMQMEAVEALGIVFDRNEIMKKSKDGAVSSEMIAEAALREPANRNHPLLAPLFDKPLVNFYWDICAPGKPAFVPMRFITAKQAIEAIHASGGIAVLAHPGANIGMQDDLAEKLLTLPIDGVEVFSSYHTDTITKFYLQKAQEKKLLITGGSNFHGENKPSVRLGQLNFNGMEKTLREAILAAIPSHDFI